MKRMLPAVACLVVAATAHAHVVQHAGAPTTRFGAPLSTAKADRDTVVLLGGWEGRFQTANGQADWQGWTTRDATGAFGDFAHILQNLQDIDPCRSNSSPQVNFVDDGEVVPGTGGSPCITWCYGPYGYVVNTTGGLTGDPDVHLDNWVLSPPLELPTGLDQVLLEFDVYMHEPFNESSPGIFWQWHVRSTDAADPTEIEAAPWQGRPSLVWGEATYLRRQEPCGDLLVPGARWVQVGLQAVDLGWIWGHDGNDATPAPYLDNVAVKAYAHPGPFLATQDLDLPQDTFPERGVLDFGNLANDWCRFDSPRGDSIVVLAASRADGAALIENPTLHYRVRANPVFDGVRQLPSGANQTGAIIAGTAIADTCRDPGGHPFPDTFCFDLPDTGFLFPGDIVHVFLSATEDLAGELRTTTWPADTTGYHDFANLSEFPRAAWQRCLPTINSAIPGDQPRVLFWNDTDEPTPGAWRYAFGNLGMPLGRDFDEYWTRAASADAADGLGDRATSSTIGSYDVLLYSSGDLPGNLLTVADLGVLENWFQLGDRAAFLTGDNLATSLSEGGPDALAFLNDRLGALVVRDDISDLIANQTNPVARAIGANGVILPETEWVAHGGCPTIRKFDAIEPLPGSVRLAEFLDPAGNDGVYSYAAVLRHEDVITLPYDFARITNAPGYVPSIPGVATRTELLLDVLVAFGRLPTGEPTAAPEARDIVVRAYPNPFNPRTTISLDLPRTAAVQLRLFDLRGRLVLTLQDGTLPAGHHDLAWNGTDGEGRGAAAGVYFYELKAGETHEVGKLMLVR